MEEITKVKIDTHIYPVKDEEARRQISSEASARASADAALDASIKAEETRAKGVEQSLQTSINNESTTRKQAIGTLNGKISANTEAITTEKSRAEGAEQNLNSKIAANTKAIANEQTRAEGAEQVLNGEIADEKTRAEGAEASLQSDISSEAQARQQADQTLDGKIDENTAAIATEKTRAKSVEQALQLAISTINGKIPAQATSQNQLADKEFVNSSVSTATADFKGTYYSLEALEQVIANANDYAFVIANDAAGNTVYKRYKWAGTGWVWEYDLNNSSFTQAQWAAIQSGITAALVTKLSDLPDNSTLNQRITQAIANALLNYYTKSEIDTALGNKQDVIQDLAAIRSGASAGATAVQPAAIADFITASVDNLENYYKKSETYTKQEVDDELATKQDILTFDNTPQSGSTNPVTSEGVKNALDTKEETANKVTSISQSSTDAQYPSANAVANAIGKRGVISQKQTWTSDFSSYTMSDIVIGIIPQSAIDLYEEAGATFNENGYQEGIGYFELNGITDLSYQNIKDAYDFSYHNNGQWTNYNSLPRTNFPLCNGIDFKGGVLGRNRGISLHLYYLYGYMEVFRLSRNLREGYGASLSAQSGYLFYNISKTLKEIMGVMDIYNARTQNYFFDGAPNLKTVRFRDLNNNISLGSSSMLSLDSVVYMVQNSANTSAITITLHPDVYAVCQADTTEYTYQGNTYTGIIALATAKNITIATA